MFEFSPKVNLYDQLVLDILEEQKFLPGRQIVEELITRFHITDETARKALQRTAAKGLINSSKPITFGNGQFIYTIPDFELGISEIKAVCKKYRPPLYRILDALENNDGILSYYEALKLSSSPETKTLSKKVNTLDELIYVLTELKLITIESDDRFVRYLITDDVENKDEAMRKHFSKMVIDCIFIPDILRWLRKVNIIDNLKTQYRNKQSPSKGVVHNDIAWDAYGYTKTTGINQVVGKKADVVQKQTLVVLDVVLNREYSQSDLDGFLSRVQLNINSVKDGVRKVMPIVFYKEISDLVLNTMGSLGFMCFDIGSVFGTRVYEIVDNLKIIQETALYDDEVSDIDTKINKTLSTIIASGQEENLGNIKGILFEYLIYPLLLTIYPNADIEHGKILTEKKDDGTTERYEYDFIIRSSNPKEIIVVEAKGYSSAQRINIGTSETQNTLSWFYGRTLPFARKMVKKEIADGYAFKASYITSATFFKDGFEFLDKQGAPLKPKKLMPYYDGDALLNLLTDNDFNNIKKTIKRYYIPDLSAFFN